MGLIIGSIIILASYSIIRKVRLYLEKIKHKKNSSKIDKQDSLEV